MIESRRQDAPTMTAARTLAFSPPTSSAGSPLMGEDEAGTAQAALKALAKLSRTTIPRRTR